MSEGSIHLEEIIAAITTPSWVNLAKSIFKISERKYIITSTCQTAKSTIQTQRPDAHKEPLEYESYLTIIKGIDDVIDLDWKVHDLNDSDIAFFSVDDADPEIKA